MIGELGYYTVGDKLFYEKIDAILHANHTLADIQWHFHKEKFDAVDWTKEPELSIDEFYRIRAQQIRDTYDYVVVFCSGGADSTNVIMSFVNNGIRVDEIIVSAPTSGLNNFKANNINTDSTNHISEIKYAAFPLVAEIKAKCPDIKITINDMFDNILHFKDQEWAFKSGDWVHPTSMGRFSINRIPHLKQLAESGKKLGLVYGVDKPVLVCNPAGFLHVVIADYGVNSPQQPFDIVYPNVDRVLFYWSPDSPQMLVKQGHIVARNIYKPENAGVRALMLDQRTPKLDCIADRDRHNHYERKIVPWIYPSIRNDLFQAGKPGTIFLGEHDAWLYELHKDTRVCEMIISDFKSLINSINSKYLTPAGVAFKVNYHSWKLGHESQFQPITLP